MTLRNPFSLLVSFALLMTFWTVMSGHLDAFHLGLGAVCVAIVLAIDSKLRRTPLAGDEIDAMARLRYGYGIYFLAWLLTQVFIAGFQVARVILTPGLRNRTCILKFRADLPNAQARVILGNSITLTPGTITLDIQGDEFTVHALTPGSYAGIVDDSMPRMVLRLFSKDDRPVIHDIRFHHSDGEPQ